MNVRIHHIYIQGESIAERTKFRGSSCLGHPRQSGTKPNAVEEKNGLQKPQKVLNSPYRQEKKLIFQRAKNMGKG